MIVGKLQVLLTGSASGFVSMLRGAKSEADRHASAIAGSFKSALTGAALAVGGVGLGSAIAKAASAEQTRTAFEVLVGDAERAKAVIADLKRLGAETPFEFPELADAGRKLLAFGTTAERVPEVLRRIGDVAAGIQVPIGEIAEIYGKAQVQGRLFAEDINQLTGRGIPVIQEFAKQFGVSTSEVKKLVESGKIGFPQLEQAFISLTSGGGKFEGMMVRQSQTLAGLFSTLKDNIGEFVTGFGDRLNQSLDLKGLVKDTGSLAQVIGGALGSTLGRTIDMVGNLGVGWRTVVTAVAGVVSAYVVMTAATKALAAAKAVLVAVSGDWRAGLLKLAVAAGIFLGVSATLNAEFAKIDAEMAKAKADADKLKEGLGGAGQGAKELAGAAALAAPAVDDMAGRLKEAAKVVEEARTPLEKFHDEANKLRDLFAEGLIKDDVFRRQFGKLKEDLDKETGGLGEKIKQLQRENSLIGLGPAARREAERQWAIQDGADPAKAGELARLQWEKGEKERAHKLNQSLAEMDIDAGAEGLSSKLGSAVREALRMGLDEEQARKLFAKAEAADLREMEKKRKDVADRLAADQPKGILAQSGEGMIAQFLTKMAAEKFAEQTASNTAEAVQVLRELRNKGADVVAI